MSYYVKILILLAAIVLVVIIGAIDTATGFIPDLTILYLIPIIAVTVYINLRFGLVIAILSSVAESVSNFLIGLAFGIAFLLDTTLHLLIFVLGAIVIDRFFTQLRTITDLESRRSYDLNVAKDVHASLFIPFPKEFRNIKIGMKIAFAREIGGDYYHIRAIDNSLFLSIADISGKSISAALFSALLHKSISDALDRTSDLAKIIEHVNSYVRPILPDNMFITLFCCIVGNEAIDFVNAGHEPPLLYSKLSNKVELLKSSVTLPIGIEETLVIELESRPFNSGDILLAVTDGITESKAFIKEPFETLEAIFLENVASDPQDIADNIFYKALPSGSTGPLDDIIIVCIKRFS